MLTPQLKYQYQCHLQNIHFCVKKKICYLKIFCVKFKKNKKIRKSNERHVPPATILMKFLNHTTQ